MCATELQEELEGLEIEEEAAFPLKDDAICCFRGHTGTLTPRYSMLQFFGACSHYVNNDAIKWPQFHSMHALFHSRFCILSVPASLQ